MVLIQLLNKLGELQMQKISKAALKNYIKKSSKGSVYYAKKETLQLLKKKAIRSKGYFEEKGKSEILGRSYTRYRFSARRKPLNSEEEVSRLIDFAKKKYKIVKNKEKKYITQRIGVAIASDPKTFDKFTNKKTNRKNTIEVLDYVSTTTYMRNKESTEGMFEELFDKIYKYGMDTSKSPSLLDDQKIKKCKYFYVFFTEN